MPVAPPVPGYDSGAPPTVGGAPPGSVQAGASAPDSNTVTVGSYKVGLQNGVNASDPVMTGGTRAIGTGGHALGEGRQQYKASPATPVGISDTVHNQLTGFDGWTTDRYQKFREQAFQMGLTASAKAPKSEVLVAWQTVLEEAVKQNMKVPDLIQKAIQGGWSSLNPNLQPSDNGLPGTGNQNNSPDASTSVSKTTYVSYMDPATAQGTLADAFQRLIGRNPTTKEYQAFLDSLYSYQDKANTGKFDSKTADITKAGPTSGASSNVQQNIVSQRQISTRGAQFLAGQTAIAHPEEGAYQAATTYFNAFAKALSGPAAGMQPSGPTNSAP